VAFNCRGLAAPLRKVTGFDYLIADFRIGPGAPAASDENDPADDAAFRFALIPPRGFCGSKAERIPAAWRWIWRVISRSSDGAIRTPTT